MSDYKRLTNKNTDEFNPEYDFCIGCKYFGEPNGCNRQGGSCGNYDQFNEMYNRLAEIEDKIENGTLVELPCNVGDQVFVVYGYEIQHTDVSSMKIESEDNHFVFILKCMVTQGGARFDEFIFGKMAFLTREEANKALEKRKQEDERKMKNAEWVKFEHELRCMLYDKGKEPTVEDMMLVDDLKQSIIIFLAKSKFNENNIVFLENAKTDFYNAINELKKRHKDIQVSNVKNFAEKFLFSEQTTNHPTEKGDE